MLHDAAANLEVGTHLERIHRGSRHVAGGLDEAANLGDERAEGAGDLVVLRDDCFLFRGHGLVLHLAFGVAAEAVIDVVVQNEIQLKSPRQTLICAIGQAVERGAISSVAQALGALEDVVSEFERCYRSSVEACLRPIAGIDQESLGCAIRAMPGDPAMTRFFSHFLLCNRSVDSVTEGNRRTV